MAQAKETAAVKAKRVTPKGIAALANIDKPHTKGKYADGKYKVTLKLEKGVEANEEFVAKLRAAEAEAVESQKAKWGKKKLEAMGVVKDGDDSDYEGDAGFYLMKFKSKNKPDRRDAKKNPLPSSVTIFGGDVIKIAYGFQAFNEPVQGKGGIALYLNAVQLLEKNALGGADAFDEEDGYEADPNAADDESEEVEDKVEDGGEPGETDANKPAKGGKGAGKFDF